MIMDAYRELVMVEFFYCLRQFKRHLVKDHIDDAAGVLEPAVEILLENDHDNEVEINDI